MLSFFSLLTAAHAFNCPTPAQPLPAGLSEASQAIWTVETDDGIGTAFVVDADGSALTAAHVVGTQDTVMVRQAAGLTLEAQVVRVVADRDVALLKLPGSGHSCLTLSNDATVGEDVWVVGAAAGLDHSVSRGIVSGSRELEGGRFWQVDASVNPGNSGGPVLTAGGTVAGVVSWKVAHADFEGLGFALSAQSVAESLANDSSPSETPSERFSTVSFTSDQSGLVIARVAQRSTVHASSQYGDINLTEVQSEDLCIAPCEVRLDPGIHELVAYGDRYTSVRHKVDLAAGSRHSFDARGGSKTARGLGNTASGLGFLGVLTSGTFWLVDELVDDVGTGIGAPLTIGSAVLMGGGITLTAASGGRWKVAPSVNP